MTYPFILTLPHCSSRVPEDIRPTLAFDEQGIWEAIDLGTRELFGEIPAVNVLCARWSRFVVDLNRSPRRRDAKGVIARIDYQGRAIFLQGHEPDREETKRRLETYYHPFHRELSRALNDPAVKALFDCYSMNGTGPRDAPDAGSRRRDITLSNYGNTRGAMEPGLGAITCPPETLHAIKEAFEQCGFSVSLNYPYRGAYIMYHYGHRFKETGKISVQIELNQDLYLERPSLKLIPSRLAEVKERMSEAFANISTLFG